MTHLLLLAVLAQQPLQPGADTAPLPPNHPPLTGAPGAVPSNPRAPQPTAVPAKPLTDAERNAPLPPNHPPMNAAPGPGPVADGEPLPPNHPPIDGTAAPRPAAGRMSGVEDLLRKLDASPEAVNKDRPFETSVTIGRLYLSQGRLKDGALYYEQAVKKAEPVRELYQAQKKLAGKAPLPAPAAVGCPAEAGATLDGLTSKAKEQVAAKRPAAAAACAKAALSPLMEVEAVLGHAKFMLGDAAGALAVYEKNLGTFEANADVRYARAALLLDSKGDDVGSLKAAKGDFERFLKEVPTSPRAPQAKRLLERTDAALVAGGMTKLVGSTPPPPPPQLPAQPVAPPFAAQQGTGVPPQLTPEQMAAFAQVKNNPEAAANLARQVEEAEEHLARGRYAEALSSYRAVMPYDPSPRVQAGMAWVQVKLGRPVAERIFGAAAQNPDEVAALGDRLKARGDEAGAKALWKKLAETVPAYAPRLQGKL